MKPPIVLTAFGTTSKALNTYAYMDSVIKDAFNGYPVVWAYTSSIIQHRLKETSDVHLKDPETVLKELADQDHQQAVVQSMHLICGHEYYKMVDRVQQVSGMQTSVGMPLLTTVDDYHTVGRALAVEELLQENEAVVLVGHGTRHPSWTSYPALENILQAQYGPDVHVVVIEKNQSKDDAIDKIARTGVRQIVMVPFMLVAGMHFQRDLTGSPDSWESAFHEKNIFTSLKQEGVGYNRKVIDIFIDHIHNALSHLTDSPT